MFPKSNHRPAFPAQLSRYLLVPLPIPFNFSPPEFTLEPVFPTGVLPAMPKIAIEEHADLFLPKHDIRLAEYCSVIKLQPPFEAGFQNRGESGFHF